MLNDFEILSFALHELVRVLGGIHHSPWLHLLHLLSNLIGSCFAISATRQQMPGQSNSQLLLPRMKLYTG